MFPEPQADEDQERAEGPLCLFQFFLFELSIQEESKVVKLSSEWGDNKLVKKKTHFKILFRVECNLFG